MASGLAAYDEFVRGIPKGSPREAYLLYGEEELLVEEALDAVLDASLAGEERQFNLDVLRAGEMDIREILSICTAFPMMAERRVVVLRDTEKLSARELELLAGYLEHPSPSTCLVLIAAKADMRKKPFHSFRKTFPVLECKPLYEDQAARWVESRVRSAGKTITEDAIRLLVAYVGTSLRALDGELAKLVLFVGVRSEIRADDVGAVVGVSREFSIFELQRALGAGDAPGAVSLLERLLDGGESPAFLLVMLTSYFVALWKVQELRRKDAPRAAIAAEIRVNPYFLNEYITGSQRYSGRQIEEALCRLADADAALKGTQAEARQILHTLLARLLSEKSTDSQALA